jgi:hypothetical protein
MRADGCTGRSELGEMWDISRHRHEGNPRIFPLAKAKRVGETALPVDSMAGALDR